ncbi:unnamed protein product [Eruca vesicaria subsp. sativa]|uniref:Uncharacterized protein n=1 Tax=Eruca vesicaria subsp. sativa TaxID=29727 RepID=A0ABC8KV66_ERUVS|nr:unnamed protein product [Eruca vesicaria subsp. sativa]
MGNPRQGNKKVSTCVGFNTDNKMKKLDSEAEKRLKKVEKDYLHASQKYKEARLQRWNLIFERDRAINLCCSAENFMNFCNQLVESLQKIIDKLPTAETKETINHVNVIPNKQYSYALNDEPIHSLRIRYYQRKLPRGSSRKAENDLLKEVRKKKMCRDKAVSNFASVCNPTFEDSLRKSVEQEIVVIKKLIRELQKDFEEKVHMEQYAMNVYACIERKVKHLEVKKEHLLGQRDIMRLNISRC